MTQDEQELHDRGEMRHERCRYGVLTKAFNIDLVTGAETPFAMPLCTWKLPERVPPDLRRRWGGGIEMGRGCAVCDCFEEIA